MADPTGRMKAEQEVPMDQRTDRKLLLTDRNLVFRHPADLDAARVTENWFLISVIMI